MKLMFVFLILGYVVGICLGELFPIAPGNPLAVSRYINLLNLKLNFIFIFNKTGEKVASRLSVAATL